MEDPVASQPTGWSIYNGGMWPKEQSFDDVSDVARADMPTGTVIIKYVMRLVSLYANLHSANPQRFPKNSRQKDIVAVPVLAYVRPGTGEEILVALPPERWHSASQIAEFLKKRIKDDDTRFHVEVDASNAQFLANYFEIISKKSVYEGLVAKPMIS